MSVIADNYQIIFLGLVVMWILQFGLAYFQMRRFYKRLAQLNRRGLTAVGLAGNRYKGRNYAVLTIDGQDRVINAEQFSGWTVFAQLVPVPALVGMPLHEILSNYSALPVSKKLQDAFANAARDLQSAREKEAQAGSVTSEGAQVCQ